MKNKPLFEIHEDKKTRQTYMSVSQKGYALITNPRTNKSTAFPSDERDALNLHGLLPPVVSTVEQQLSRTYESFSAKGTALEKYIYLASLQDRNEVLYYRLLQEHIAEMLPIVYTPTVGEACQRFSHIYRNPRGLYMSYEHRHMIEKLLRNAPCKEPSVIVVTDGERILGLGDQGAGGMGISIGKLCLYTLCAGIPPEETLPIFLDVGTDNLERLQDPLYVGLRRKRVRGQEYQDFVDTFVAAVKKVFPNTILQWEDFLKDNAMKQLNRFRNELCTFNDDIQGTAAVTLSGIYAALRVTKRPMSEQRVLIAGAGASAQGIAGLIVLALQESGLSLDRARKCIWTCDSKGLVTKSRQNLEEFKALYARDPAELLHYQCQDKEKITLEETIHNVKPSILLGTSGMPGLFTENIIKAMTAYHERPIIFPLSNPTSKAECTAEAAVTWSGGKAVVATGSPFAPVVYNGQEFRIGQCNNAYIFPGLGLGVKLSGAKRIPDTLFLAAAKALAQVVTDHDLQVGRLFPPLEKIRQCSHAVACAVISKAVDEKLADKNVLHDLEKTVYTHMWQPEYLPIRYEE